MANPVIVTLQEQITQKENELNVLKQALALLTGGEVALAVDAAATNTKQYEGLGIVDATRRFLREVGEPRSTGEIKDALLERGWTTKSKNATATIYATLDNSRQFVRRDGMWQIKEGKTHS